MSPNNKLKQHTLDNFIGSSSPARPPAISRATGRIHKPSNVARQKRHIRNPPSHIRDSPHALMDRESSESSHMGDIHFETQVIDLDDSDEVISPRRPFAKKRKTGIMRTDSEDERVVTSAPVHNDTQTTPEIPRYKVKRGKTRVAVISTDTEDEDALPRKRKMVKGVRPPSPEENDADLLDEVDEEKIIEPRLRARGKRTAFQQNLEKLRRKKRGESIISTSSASTGGSDDEQVPFVHARPDNDDAETEGVESEDNDDNFIVEDENTEAPELPIAFSMHSHQDLAHQFKIVCQFFVHIAIHPISSRRSVREQLMNQDYFSVPLSVTRRKIVGMRDSLVTSSVWRPDFKKPLEMYPNLETIRLDFAIPACDACHLGGRMSTLLGRLSGSPYDRETFESIAEPEASDTDADDDDEPRLKPKKEFHLGRFCAARTRVFHKFTHWEYALYTALLQEVNELRNSGGTHGFIRVGFPGGMPPPDDLSDADGIMDWLDQRHVISMEWQKVKEMMESARNLEAKGKKGEDEDD